MRRETRRAPARVFACAEVGRGIKPSSHPMAANGSRLVSEPTDRPKLTKGFRDVGNGQSTVLTNLCAPQAELEQLDMILEPHTSADSTTSISEQLEPDHFCRPTGHEAGTGLALPRRPSIYTPHRLSPWYHSSLLIAILP